MNYTTCPLLGETVSTESELRAEIRKFKCRTYFLAGVLVTLCLFTVGSFALGGSDFSPANISGRRLAEDSFDSSFDEAEDEEDDDEEDEDEEDEDEEDAEEDEEEEDFTMFDEEGRVLRSRGPRLCVNWCKAGLGGKNWSTAHYRSGKREFFCYDGGNVRGAINAKKTYPVPHTRDNGEILERWAKASDCKVWDTDRKEAELDAEFPKAAGYTRSKRGYCKKSRGRKTLKTVTSSSTGNCAILCNNNSQCSSFSWSTTKKCKLHSGKCSSTKSRVIVRTGKTYYNFYK